MKMDKTVLVIDDEDQQDDIRSLESLASRKGINLTCYQFNVGGQNEPGLLTAGRIDVDKVKSAYKERFRDRGIEFNMIVCDWGLSDEFVDGAELMRKLVGDCFSHKIPIILYSGLLREKIEEQLDKYDKKEPETKEPVVKYIVSLIRSNYLDFVGRETLKSTVIGHLKDSEDIDIALQMVLNKYPDKVMAVGHGHSLENKTFAEVAALLRTNEEVRYDFKRNVIEEVIQYLTEKQAKKV